MLKQEWDDQFRKSQEDAAAERTRKEEAQRLFQQQQSEALEKQRRELVSDFLIVIGVGKILESYQQEHFGGQGVIQPVFTSYKSAEYYVTKKKKKKKKKKIQNDTCLARG
jgi:hypothetical protein